eukprot:COSAG05_NODE_674_length_7989_cov_2.918504_3_plen_58_part_00
MEASAEILLTCTPVVHCHIVLVVQGSAVALFICDTYYHVQSEFHECCREQAVGKKDF